MAWPVFPLCPSFGFSKLADYSATIVERSSGIRTVNRNWYYPLHTFAAVPIDGRNEDDMVLVMRFWHAIGGQSGQFRFKDYTDYRSTDSPGDAISSLDQPLIETETSNVWQMMKLYVDESFAYQQYRLIQKPIDGTILIADNGSSLTEGDDYTVDYETGLVTFDSSALPAGVPTWGGQFHVPVMFESTPEFMIINKKFQRTGFALRELRLEEPTLVDFS